MYQIFTAFPDCWSTISYNRLNPTDIYLKSTPKENADYLRDNRELILKNTLPLQGTERWRRVIYYKFTPQNASYLKDTFERKEGILCVDERSEYVGNIYLEELKILDYCKFFHLSLARPLLTVAKTLYHLSLGWFFAIGKSLKDKKAPPLSQLLARNFMDIIRTPLYGVIMTIVTLTALIVVPFNTNSIYDFKAFIGKLSHELHWGVRPRLKFLDDLNPCMRRRDNLVDLVKSNSLRWTPE